MLLWFDNISVNRSKNYDGKHSSLLLRPNLRNWISPEGNTFQILFNFTNERRTDEYEGKKASTRREIDTLRLLHAIKKKKYKYKFPRCFFLDRITIEMRTSSNKQTERKKNEMNEMKQEEARRTEFYDFTMPSRKTTKSPIHSCKYVREQIWEAALLFSLPKTVRKCVHFSLTQSRANSKQNNTLYCGAEGNGERRQHEWYTSKCLTSWFFSHFFRVSLSSFCSLARGISLCARNSFQIPH